jgi:hypothetical protein
MKIRVKKKVLFGILSAYILVFLLVPLALVFGEGCPPNDACPSGWEPRPIRCITTTCDENTAWGYCILCAPEQI